MSVMLRNYKNSFEKLNEVKAGETGTGLLIERDWHITGTKETLSQIREDIENGQRFAIPDNFVVSAIFQKYGIKNANGRIYPEDILKREVQKYLENQVRNHSAVGALDHPSYSTLSGHDISHRILDLRWEGRTLVGEMKLHLSPGFKKYGVCSTSGDLVANMLIDDVRVGVSSRALGSIEDKFGSLIVCDDLDLIGWDVVLEPSTPNAWVSEDMANLQSFIEDKKRDESKLFTEKINRINSILD